MLNGDTTAISLQSAELSARLLAAQAENAAKDAFIAAISRELNNPLAPVLLAVEHMRLLLPGGDAQRLEAAMQKLERATEGFARRTRALLDLVDLSAGVQRLPTGPLDLPLLVAEAVSEAGEMARLAGCALVLEVPRGLVAVGNAEALQQVLGHILANAFRFGAGRPVRVSGCCMTQGGAVITVSDDGPGISSDKADSLFALFQQARAPLEPGLGIGLWVASRLVAAMGGTIAADSGKGLGTHFHVSLPAPQPPSVAPTP